MAGYVLGKLLGAIAVLLILSIVVFGAVFLSGDVASVIIPRGGGGVNLKTFLELKKLYGLSDPFLVQYGRFLHNLVTHFNFGYSLIEQRPVGDMLAERIPYTIQLAGTSVALGIVVGIPLGIVSAVKHNSILDHMSRLFSTVGMAAPQFWVGIMLILLFAAKLKWLPAYGVGGPEHLVLPTVTLSLFLIAGIASFVRSSMLEVLSSDYIKFARTKGLHERLIVWKHAFRNAVIPMITFLGLELAGVLNGAVVVEIVFARPGIGTLMIDGVMQRDFAVVEGTVLAAAFFYVMTSLLVDVTYAVVDPRIRSK
jgi:peptide/nickel transport system permease protein